MAPQASNRVIVAKKSALSNFAMIPLGAAIGGFAIALLVSTFLVHTSLVSEHRVALTNLKVESLRQRLDDQLFQINAQLSQIATNVNLAQIVRENVASDRAFEETALTAIIPNAIKVRIFGLGEAEIERDTIPPFSFTSLDLVNQVETGRDANAEAINSNGRWIISFAFPIRFPSDDTILGTLFVYLDPSVITQSLSESTDGELNIIQSVGGATSAEILSLGQGSIDADSLTRNLANPNWVIEYTPSPEFADQSVGGITSQLMPLIVLLLGSVGGILFGINRLVQMLRTDLLHLDHQIASVASGRFESSTAYQFDGFIEVDEGLARLRKKPLEDTIVPKLNVTAVTQEPSDDGLVDIEMLDDESFEDALEKHESQTTGGDDYFASIFRAYDIRGIVNDTLTPEIIHSIGLAVGSEAQDIGQQSLLVGADGRVSSPDVMEALITGIRASGCDVICIGAVPTPLLYFATHNSETQSGVMVTGSHNPPDYNGFKIVLDGRALVEDDIQRLYQRIQNNDFSTGEGEFSQVDIREDYIDAISDDVVVAQPLSVVIDCGNGIAGDIAPDLLSNLGCEVTPLYCEVDGTFPNHSPDPTIKENLSDLILTVKSSNADLGIALDGDGDRMVAVTREGEIIFPDRLLMLFAKDVVSRNPGSDVVYDVKCTRHLNSVISGFGGRPVLSRSGHSFVKQKMAETDAILGGEMSGHICFSERWYGFDDGIYAAARLLEIVGSQTAGLTELLAEFPTSLSTPELYIPLADDRKFTVIEQLEGQADFGDGAITTIDGIRVDYADGWGLIRASNTNPQLTLRFEADDTSALNRIMELFRNQLQTIDEELDFE